MTRTLGYVETQRVVLADQDNPLRLRGGGRLDHVEVAYETYGELSPARDNAVFICHALTGDAHAAGLHLGAKKRGWWDNLIGPGKAVDTDRYFVISANLLGGCSGTTGPLSINPATGRVYGLDFPMLHMTDLVAVQRRLAAHLGIERLYAAVGGSLGGMQVLQRPRRGSRRRTSPSPRSGARRSCPTPTSARAATPSAASSPGAARRSRG